MKTSHVEGTTCSLVCAHCRATDSLASVSADHLIDAVRGFLLRHRRCEKPIEPSKQVELFDELVRQENRITSRPPAPFTDITYVDADAISLSSNGISVLTDEPAPEIDPPGPRDVFAEMYPMARDVVALRHELSGVLNVAQFAVFLGSPIPHPGTPAFDELAHWSRCSKAHSERQAAKQRGEPSISGLYVPAVPPMPAVLREALGKLAPKEKRGARPFSSPSAEMPVTPPAKKTRKRRSV